MVDNYFHPRANGLA